MAELPSKAQERPAIPRQIDRAYIACVMNSMALQKYLIAPRGPLEPLYMDFYECFSVLFSLTSPYRDIAGDDANPLPLVGEIRQWLDPAKTTAITPEKALAGIRLFSEWQKVLARKDVISWRV